ncbi:MAG: hypothetical protein ACP5I3_11705, partial [Thermoproteus sp.]
DAPVVDMKEIIWLKSYVEAFLNSRLSTGDVVYKAYAAQAVPLMGTLRKHGVMLSDRYLVEKLAKLFAGYLVVYGINVENLVNALYELLPYAARTEEELKAINKAIDEALGEVAELAEKLEAAKKFYKAGQLQDAKKLLLEVVSFDVSEKLKDKQWVKPRVEAVIASARHYLEQIKRFEAQLQAE